VNPAIRICPVCEQGTLSPETYSEDIRHNGATLTVSGLERCRCSHCDADPVLRDQIRRNQVRLCDARRLADGLMTGEKIRALRERFGLSQPDAAAVFGGGANAFSKYERGEVTQSLPMDRLLRCSEAFPLLVDYLRRVAGLDPRSGSAAKAYIQTSDSLRLNDPHYTSRPIPGAQAVPVSESSDENTTVVSLHELRKRAA
jgi:HTH-type transcriptional regulator/antitoxin MqsA